MSNGPERRRIILRTELHWGDQIVVSYGFDLTTASIFVVTELHVPVDTVVSVRLSLPKVLAPIEVAARVTEIAIAGGPGDLGGIRLAFEPANAEDQAKIVALQAQLDAASDAVPTQKRARRLLLVEDNQFVRDVFVYGLTKFFDTPGLFTVDYAEDAEQAWDKLAQSTYDVVIVDYYLPAEDGASLISRLRRDPRLLQIPVVAISVGGGDAREATLSAGADLFLDKPVVFQDLFGTLGLLLRHEAQRSTDSKKTILVLDDSPMALAVTRSALESAGFEVAIAVDLSSFEQQWVSFDPDLILVDVQMPEAFGDDVASTLRGRHGVRAPILLLSSLDESELAWRAQQAQATGWVSKAAGTTELVRRCKELLAS